MTYIIERLYFQLWDETICPWIDLLEIRLTTPLTCSALRRTYFNITDKPTCLKFPSPVSVHDYRSYHRVCCTMYTTMEIKVCLHALLLDPPTYFTSPPPRFLFVSYIYIYTYITNNRISDTLYLSYSLSLSSSLSL